MKKTGLIGVIIFLCLLSNSWAQESYNPRQNLDYNTINSDDNSKLPQDAFGLRSAWEVQFNYSGLESYSAGSETDGSYIYVTNWNASDIWKYDLSGKLVEKFSIAGVSNLRDLAYDGTYFYGGTASSTIYKMDFTNKSLVGTFTSPNEDVRHICYDPLSNAFWVGNWETNWDLVDTNGTVLRTINSSTHGLGSIYGTAYDTITPGGPYIWAITANSSTNTSIYQVDVTTGEATGYNHDCTSDICDPGLLGGGLWIHPNIVSGTVTLGGVIQNNFIFGYKLSSVIPDSFDLAVQTIDVDDNPIIGSSVTISGTILNNGLSPITSLDLTYEIDGGTANVDNLTGLNIQPFQAFTYNHTVKWTPTLGFHDITVYVSNPNGKQDQFMSNDTMIKPVFANEGISGTKRVLVEEGTGAWCGYCPDGALKLKEILHNNQGDVIGVAHHNRDGMDFTAGNAINSAFASGYPTGYVDRVFFEEYGGVGFSRSYWATEVAKRLNEKTPLNISISNVNYNEGTRELDFDVAVDFVDYAYGDLRITAMLTENYITGTGSDYDQKNYYNTTSGHELFGLGNPIVGYVHNHVSREFLSDTWGDKLESASGAVMFNKGATYNLDFSTTLDNNWDAGHMQIIVFVSHYNSDENKREVLNVVETGYFTTSSVDENTNVLKVGEVYPNPCQSLGRISFSLEKTSQVSLSVYNSMGQLVQANTARNFASGEHAIYIATEELVSGSYFVVLNIDGVNYTRKMLKQ